MYEGKYHKLNEFLNNLSAISHLTLTFAEIENILHFRLPDSAYKYPAWWANQQDGNHSHARSWLYAGWKTCDLEPGKKVSFARNL